MRTCFLLSALLLCVMIGTVVAANPSCSGAEPAVSAELHLPVWNQWEANHGYCGEAALVVAGMHFGQYCSQYEARRLASPGIPQSRAASQLLLGVNEVRAAGAMKLRARAWRGGSPARFVGWIERNIAAGYPVIVGVYMNQFAFYGTSGPSDGEAEYDHIVTIGATAPDSRGGAPRRLHFQDHGLFKPPGNKSFRGNVGLDKFANTRAGANSPEAGPYSLPNDDRNYGLAILGPADRDGVTLPVRLAASARGENPPIADGEEEPPPARPFDLVVRVSIPDPSEIVHLYLYDDFSAVPDCNFNALAARAVRRWVFAPRVGNEIVVRVRIASDRVAAFRAVPAGAP